MERIVKLVCTFCQEWNVIKDFFNLCGYKIMIPLELDRWLVKIIIINGPDGQHINLFKEHLLPIYVTFGHRIYSPFCAFQSVER